MADVNVTNNQVVASSSTPSGSPVIGYPFSTRVPGEAKTGKPADADASSGTGSTQPAAAPSGDDDSSETSIWWLETMSMISSMNVDNATSMSYLSEMDAQSKVVANMSQELSQLSQTIQQQASDDKSLSPWKMMGVIIGVAVGAVILGAAMGPLGLGLVGTLGAVAIGGLTGGAIIGTVVGLGTTKPDTVSGLTDSSISTDHQEEDNTNQQLYSMIGSNATQKENLAQTLGPQATSQKQETWANIIDAVIQAEQQTNSIRI